MLFICSSCTQSFAQRDLPFYIAQAAANSPLIKESHNLSQAAQLEVQRIRASYNRPEVSITSNYLLSPTFRLKNGEVQGYDQAISNGGQYSAQLNIAQNLLTKPLISAQSYAAGLQGLVAENAVLLTAHQLEQLVTDQYITAYEDSAQAGYLLGSLKLLAEEQAVIEALVNRGEASQRDLLQARIEAQAQQALLAGYQAAYRRDILDLNITAGIADTARVSLAEPALALAKGGSYSRFLEQYRLDSLIAQAGLRVFELKYKPMVGVFANAGLNTTTASNFQHYFGYSAGLNFSFILFDGHQRSYEVQKARLGGQSASAYKSNFLNQNTVRTYKLLGQLAAADNNIHLLEQQRSTYDKLINLSKLELQRGQVLISNYILTLKAYAALNRDLVLARSAKLRLINEYNYWQW